jgi:uncharacterized protein YdhG (YjbR/CyaY superfamily)
MTIEANSPEEYISKLPPERKAAIEKLHNIIMENLPEGFAKAVGYGMMGYVVPHSVYPAGYHCDPKQPLPFMGLASQKNFISFYHMGIYAEPQLMEWFIGEYSKMIKTKIDMGKSCIRFKKPEQIPYELIGELVRKISVEKWIEIYETKIKR